ncbi:hypothetical protein BH11MYX3_BH11MYX3_01040 [soil metagenome]
MLARLLAASLLLAACSKKTEPPSGAAELATTAVESPEALGFPLVPDGIASQLGSANVVITIDLAKFGLAQLAPMVPEGLDCVRGLLGKAGLVVIAMGDHPQGFVTGMPQDATLKCVTELAPLLGATTRPAGDAFHLVVGGDTYAIRWTKDGVTTIRDEAHPMNITAPTPKMRELIKQLPRDAYAWVISGGFPKFKITSSVAWLTSASDAWHLVVTGESPEPGVAASWLEGIPKGFKQGAATKGLVIEDSWFKVTSSSPSRARLDGNLPADLFTRVTE